MYGRTLGALEGLQRTLRSFTSIDLASVGTLCSPESSFRSEPQNAQAVPECMACVVHYFYVWVVVDLVLLSFDDSGNFYSAS